MKKKVCVVTSTRAEFGLLKPVISQIEADDTMQLLLVVTGAHLNQSLGMTVNEIAGSGLPIYKEICVTLPNNSQSDVAAIMGETLQRFGRFFFETRPDIVILLGDRYEIMAVAMAAAVCTLPIAHIHGGEITEGAIDDVFRHCITKMSHLHFASTEAYRQRIIQMGEAPERVFNVGALGAENAKKEKTVKKEELEQELGFGITDQTVLATFHPETLESDTPQEQLQPLLRALDDLNLRVVFTKANADAGGMMINNILENYVARNKNRAVLFASLGQRRYLSMVKYARAVIGNSSSGIIEAPVLGTASVNIGNRQKGRIHGNSVIDCENSTNAIKASIQQAMSMSFQMMCQKSLENPYLGLNTSHQIVDTIKNWLGGCSMSPVKSFYDINFRA